MPMYYNSDDQVKRIADALEDISKQDRIGNLLLANDGLYMAGAINDETYAQVIKGIIEELVRTDG